MFLRDITWKSHTAAIYKKKKSLLSYNVQNQILKNPTSILDVFEYCNNDFFVIDIYQNGYLKITQKRTAKHLKKKKTPLTSH